MAEGYKLRLFDGAAVRGPTGYAVRKASAVCDLCPPGLTPYRLLCTISDMVPCTACVGANRYVNHAGTPNGQFDLTFTEEYLSGGYSCAWALERTDISVVRQSFSYDCPTGPHTDYTLNIMTILVGFLAAAGSWRAVIAIRGEAGGSSRPCFFCIGGNPCSAERTYVNTYPCSSTYFPPWAGGSITTEPIL